MIMAENSPHTIQSFREMRASVRALTPAIAWPTLVMALTLPFVTAGIIALAVTGEIPLLAATPVLGYLVYCHFIYVHESIHNNIFPGQPKLAFLENIFGWIGATTLISTYPQLKHVHLMHHAHLNGPDDPDALLARGTFKKLVIGSIVSIFLNAFPPSIRESIIGGETLKKFRTDLPPKIWRIHDALGWAQSLVGLACILSGYGLEWFLLWLAPGRIGFMILSIFIVWAPHQPYKEGDQFTGTRLFFAPGVTLFMWWNNMHLLHHLFPGLPFYRYPDFYRQYRPALIASGARVEGLVPGSKPSAEIGVNRPLVPAE